jgi:hypothetical protein
MSKYKANNTMELLGYQYWVNGEAREQIEDVIMAYKDDFDLLDFAVDVFNLGMINGIRKERSRK